MSSSPYNTPYKSAAGLAKVEAAWATAVRLQQFGYAEIASAISVEIKRAIQIVGVWEDEGLIRVIRGNNRGRPRKIFEVLPEQEQRPAPVIGDCYDQMWTVLRKFGSVSPVDLIAHCSVEVSIEDARSYCRKLLEAGYLRVVQQAVPGKKEAIYRLKNATGPKAPRKRRVTCVIDANLNTVTPLSEAGL
jgi:hypothetical protein